MVDSRKLGEKMPKIKVQGWYLSKFLSIFLAQVVFINIPMSVSAMSYLIQAEKKTTVPARLSASENYTFFIKILYCS